VVVVVSFDEKDDSPFVGMLELVFASEHRCSRRRWPPSDNTPLRRGGRVAVRGAVNRSRRRSPIALGWASVPGMTPER
jgi:hypothetical protein